MGTEGEGTKEGFLGEDSYSKAFPQLPNPMRKSPSSFAWHVRPYSIWSLLPFFLFSMPFSLLPTQTPSVL